MNLLLKKLFKIIFSKFFVHACFFILSFFALSFSFFVEFSWNIKACDLCKLQRIPYFGLMLISFFSFFFDKHLFFSRLISFLAIIGLALSLYHIGIIYDFFSERCISEIPKDFDKYESFLFKGKSCKKNIWKIFGLPASFFNILMFVFVFVLNFFKKENVN